MKPSIVSKAGLIPIAAACISLVACTSAFATTTTFDLQASLSANSGASCVAAGCSITGSFVFDSVSDTISDGNFSVVGETPSVGPFTTVDLFDDVVTGGNLYIPVDDGSGNVLSLEFSLFNLSQIAAGDSVSLLVANCFLAPNGCSSTSYSWSGSTTLTASATPVPPALPLFASAMAGMGVLEWRRKRKTAATTFA